ncbi:MAG: hypothetical protein HZB25_04855 [Candidatus Eisenbacteria bacterium]|nr:hypothetical protein [Candidatus Eisenbacteria bacterium]
MSPPAGLGGRRLRAPAVRVATLAALLGAGLALAAGAPGRFARTPQEITAALAGSPHTGECNQCHTQHGTNEIAYPNALLGPNANTLCDGCHTTPFKGGSYGLTLLYNGSAHGSGPSMIWPGPTPPARTEAGGASKCLNCHDPHSWSDATGVIPHLAVAREEKLCLTCHDGLPAARNVQSDMLKAYRHPVQDYTGRHTGADEALSGDFAASPVNRRHSECEDCHNPHVARTDPTGGFPTTNAPKSTLGVSRVRVLNGAAGTAPVYTFTAGSDTLTSPVAEYQLCFKCHSGWTIQPTGQTDFGKVLNTNNPSFHPVEGQGRNLNIRAGAFAVGWSPTSTTPCGSCHGSDAGSVRGPHGSNNRYILKQPYTASSASRTMVSSEICFLCHTYNTYANRNAGNTVLGYSRFNPPNFGEGHAFHVIDQRRPCYACHATHGSANQKHLIVTGRNPGINSYTETTNGGTCSPTCHGTETYTINYAR